MIVDNEPLADDDLKRLHAAVNEPMNAVKYLAIDPGESNGVCGYDAKFHLSFMFTIREQDMLKFLDCFESIQVCVVEKFTLYPNKAMKQVYSTMPTSRVIGRIEGWAARNKVNLVMQSAAIKATGYAWLGKKPPAKSNPDNHKMDAHVHFMFWAIKNRKIDAGILLEINRRRRDD